MAEFCLECWNKINNGKDDEKNYILSKELELCEECGEWKHVIIAERRCYYEYRYRHFILPYYIIYGIVYCLWRLLRYLFKIFKKKSKKHL